MRESRYLVVSCLPCCICGVDKSWASLFRASGLEHFVSSKFRHKQNTLLFNCQRDLKLLTLCCFFFFFLHSNHNGEAEEKTRNRERTSVHSVSGQPQCSLWIWRWSSFCWGFQELSFSYSPLWVFCMGKRYCSEDFGCDFFRVFLVLLELPELKILSF